MAFIDDKIQETGFLASILNAGKSQRAKIRHYLKPFKIAKAIQLCRCDLAWLIICKLWQIQQNYSRISAKINFLLFGGVLVGTVFTFLRRHQDLYLEFNITIFWIGEKQYFLMSKM